MRDGKLNQRKGALMSAGVLFRGLARPMISQ
jgi:hypothetical protein